jgi:hypothetical protein
MTAARCESDQHHGGESVTWHQQVGHILHALRKLEVHLRRRGEEYCERVRGGAREGRHDHASVHTKEEWTRTCKTIEMTRSTTRMQSTTDNGLLFPLG